MRRRLLTVAALLLIGSQGPITLERQNEHFVPSQPDTLSWGWFPIDAPPVLTIQSGETVRIDTLSHAGATQDAHPETSLAELGVAPDDPLSSRAASPRTARGGVDGRRASASSRQDGR